MTTTALKLELVPGESVTFDRGRITVTLLEKSGQRARLDIKADESVDIQPPRATRTIEQIKKGLSMK